MGDTTLRLHIEKCRAIQEANISLDDITVLTGVNASGKSTIAHIFSSLLGLSENYQRLKNRGIWTPFIETERNLNLLEQRLLGDAPSILGARPTLFVRDQIDKIGVASALKEFERRYEYVIS